MRRGVTPGSEGGWGEGTASTHEAALCSGSSFIKRDDFRLEATILSTWASMK